MLKNNQFKMTVEICFMKITEILVHRMYYMEKHLDFKITEKQSLQKDPWDKIQRERRAGKDPEKKTHRERPLGNDAGERSRGKDPGGL